MTPSEISWSAYRQYSGPFYRGKHPYRLPPILTDDDRILAVITATEGGHYDAINMYDGQIISSGLIQFIERGQYSVSAMIGAAMDREPELMKELEEALELSKAEFKKDDRGRWRFFFKDSRGKVDRLQEQQQLMLGVSNGEKGTWDDSSKALAKSWASGVATVWKYSVAQEAQRQFTVPKLRLFAFGESKKIVKHAETIGSDLCRAFVAAYLSFAVNNPTRANKHLLRATKATDFTPWTRGWLIDVLKELTFGPKISIYPHRYDAIRPKLEQLYGIELPDFAKELESWKEGSEVFYDTAEVQQALLALGYDLGPSKADGQYGRKTREAVLLFEQQHGLEADGMMDIATANKLEEVLERQASELLKEHG